MSINEKRGNRISAKRTNSGRTYDQVKHNGHGEKEKKKFVCQNLIHTIHVINFSMVLLYEIYFLV